MVDILARARDLSFMVTTTRTHTPIRARGKKVGKMDRKPARNNNPTKKEERGRATASRTGFHARVDLAEEAEKHRVERRRRRGDTVPPPLPSAPRVTMFVG